MNSVYRALILCSSLKDAEEFARHVSSKNYPAMHFVYPSNLSHNKMNFDDLLSDCRSLMNEEEYDIVIVIEPGLEFLQALLASEFSHLNTASPEGVFLCLNRLYSYKHILYGFAPSYAVVELEGYDPKVSSSSIAGMLENLESDCEVISSYSLHPHYPLIIHSAKQFNREVSELQKVVKNNNDSLANILRDSVSFSKYDSALDLTCLFVETRHPSSSVHLVEGCVVGEEFIPLIISDLLHWDERPHCLQAVSTPSKLEDNDQYQIWATMREVAQRLVPHGFDYQLFRAKVSYGPDSTVKVMELNSCIDASNMKALKHVYTNGDLLSASLDIGLGRTPRRPKLLPHRHALRIYLSCFPSEPCPAGELMDFIAVRNEPNSHLHEKENVEVTPDNNYGHLLVSVTIMERSFTACMRKALSITKKVLYENSNSPWLDQDFNDYESTSTESALGTPRFESRPASELSIVLPSIQASRRSSLEISPEEMEAGLSAVATKKPASVSPEFPRRASSSTLSPLTGARRRNGSLSPRRLSPIPSAGRPQNGEHRRRPSNRLSPLATQISQRVPPSDELRPLKSPMKPRDLTPVPKVAPTRRLSTSSLDLSFRRSPDFQLAKTVAHHNRRKSIDLQMTVLERAQHMRRLSDAAALATIKLPSLNRDSGSSSSRGSSDGLE